MCFGKNWVNAEKTGGVLNMNKYERHMAILSIIKQQDVQTQSELADILNKSGMDVTQATVSRDIKELRLIKVLSHDGIYKYASGKTDNPSDVEGRLSAVFANSVVSVENSSNIIVIKTLAGMASAAASAIDAMKYNEILGCIAGDDTIFVVADSKKDTDKISSRLRAMMQ